MTSAIPEVAMKSVRVLLALSVIASCLAGTSATALPLDHKAAALAKNGVAALRLSALDVSTTPLPSSPVTGTLDASGDASDAFTVSLLPGDRLNVELTGEAGTDVDLYLLWPTATKINEFDLAAAAVGTTYPERLTFDCAAAGVYYLHAFGSSGSGAYSMNWSVTRAVSSPVIGRAAGATRYETAIAASVRAYSPGTSRDVVLATGERFPDALASAGLAGALGCPVLLTPRGSIPSAVLAEMSRLGATDIHIVGGPAAVSDAVRSTLVSRGYKTYRYAGQNRYATSAVVADAALTLRSGSPAYAFVARGDDYADALSVSPVAYQHAYPILLTASTGLTPSVRAALERSRPKTVLVAGGASAVPARVVDEIRALPHRPTVVRVGGPTRYETATGFAAYSLSRFLAMPEYVGIVNGTRFPDAVVGGPGVGARGGVLLLTPGETLSGSARSSLQGWERNGLVDHLVIYGGTVAVSRAVQDQISAVFR